MGRNLENGKKLKPVQIINSVGMTSKNIGNSVGSFNDGDVMDSISGYTT